MRAEAVWHVWRRILREPPLQQAVFAGPVTEGAARDLGLGPAERDIVEAYAASPDGTRFFVENYRFRMISSFVNALETAAPLTHRLLRADAVDVDALAVSFLDTVAWHDFGPYVYGFARRVLRWLLTREEFSSRRGMPELVALELAGADVVIAGATDGHTVPTAPGGADTVRYLANPRAQAVHCALDLSPWLRNGAPVGRTDPPERPRWFLVYLRPPEWERRIVALPARGVAVLEALEGTPLTARELSERLREGGGADDAAAGDGLLGRLVQIGAVHPCAGGA